MVTVISLSYNEEELLKSIDSVLCQTYGSIEYILIDDCSDDFDEAFYSEYISSRKGNNITSFSVIRNEKNMGTVFSQNRAIKASHGRYIFNLAGDDLFNDENVISDWVKFFDESKCLFSTAKMAVYNGDDFVALQPDERQMRLLKNASPSELFEETAAVNFIFGCCTAYSHKCLEQYGLYDERYRLIDDHPMILKLLRNGVSVGFLDRTVVKYASGGVSSLDRVNEVYERDADLVFKNEALPFTKYPGRCKSEYRRFKKWKRNRQNRERYISALNTEKSALKRFLLKARYNALHPSNKIIEIKNKLTGKENKPWTFV